MIFRYWVTYTGTLEAEDEDRAVERAVDMVEFGGIPDSVDVEAESDDERA